MSTQVLAAQSVEVGTHPEVQLFGFTLHIDTIVATVIAGGILVGAGLYMARRATAGVPSGLQLAFEAVTDYVERLVDENIGMKRAPFVVPLAVTLFCFILLCNWMALLPGGYQYLPPPTADVNLVYPMALLVIVWVHVTGIRTRGIRAYLKGYTHGGIALTPINVVEEISKPISLSLRLFGNVFGGVVMVSLIGLLPPLVLWAPDIAWKLFELFIGVIQAFIFALLTVLYFSFQAGQEQEAH